MNKQQEIIGSGCGTDAFLLRRDPFWLQSSLLHSKPKSTVGTPAYIAPEVLSRGEYDGKVSALICSSLLIIALQLGYLTIYCTLFLNLLFASTMLVCCASLLSDTLWLWR